MSDQVEHQTHKTPEDTQWDFWIDRGGTFTDIIARDSSQQLHTLKLLSDNPDLYEDAVLYGIRYILGSDLDKPIPLRRIASVRMGTTVATNALLEHTGANTLFVTTRGFADALEIGDQSRADIFALNIIKPKMLYTAVSRITERIRADGSIAIPLDLEQVRTNLSAAFQKGFRTIAIAFVHGYAYPRHEKQVAKLAKEIGFSQISVSHEVSPLIKFISRADSTVVDAYLSPVLKNYINRIRQELSLPTKKDDKNREEMLHFMQSSGNLVSAPLFQGKDAILSGPAGGVIGAIQSAEQAGFDKIIGFDMGGTSTDVCHYAGEIEHRLESTIAGIKLRVPMLNIHTVAAGGGSLLHFDKHRFRVGPDSAGSTPGPACYRGGGALTLTDANVMTGKIRPEFFPALFGDQGNQPLDKIVVRELFLELCSQSDNRPPPEEIADGFVTIAVENMANAIVQISIRNGHDLSGYALNCFGGASGQHACLVAERLELDTIIIHPLSGLLSAYGMGLATTGTSRQTSVEKKLNQGELDEVSERAQLLKKRNIEDLERQNIEPECISHDILVHLRYDNSDIAFPIPLAEHAAQMRRAFERDHEQRFGFSSPETQIIIELVEVKTIHTPDNHQEAELPLATEPLGDPHQQTQFYSQGQWHFAKLFLRSQLGISHQLSGPAIIIEDHQTIVVEAGWQAKINRKNHLILTKVQTLPKQQNTTALKFSPVMVEVFNSSFMSIARQMGYVLQNTAQSVNIRDRKDFSCAIFDAEGELVANAPHMPVHLGSMDCSVKAVVKAAKNDIKAGDSFAINAPYNGGTHLPDITVVTPVFNTEKTQIIFFVASRGHHGDIGGITPGSMSPHAKTIEEEGVYIDCFKLVDAEIFQEEKLLNLLTNAPYPARQPHKNIADLKAQLAANIKGITELDKIINHYGLPTVQNYMRFIQDNAEESVRAVISTMKDCYFELETDDKRIVSVSITVNQDARSAVIDFTDTSPQRDDNFNAPEPVTRAAVLYVFRTLVNDDIPLNAGCLKPLKIIIPEHSMLSPTYPAAVVAGNVETSQLIVDCLFAALGKLAPSQGTMNNLTFGNDCYQYYETICSGAPAGNGFNGANAVHTHMTNSQLTDPEILELHYPVLLEQFAINQGSGGKGRYNAGDGVLRKIVFLEKMNCAILSSYRDLPPPGLSGGTSGIKGENWIRKKDGRLVQLHGCDETTLHEGEAIIIKTPTGGGFGKK